MDYFIPLIGPGQTRIIVTQTEWEIIVTQDHTKIINLLLNLVILLFLN